MEVRIAYQESLRSLRDALIRMATTVKEMLHDATTAMDEEGRTRIADLMLKEPTIDELDREVQEHCIDLIATQAPMASDLRTLFAYLKIATDLERIADYCVGIGKKLRLLHELPNGGEFSRPVSMARRAEEMMDIAVRDLVDPNPEAAALIKCMDREMDAENNRSFMTYTSRPLATADQVKVVADLVLISRAYERIGDHVVNLTRRLYYVVTGAWDESQRSNV